MRCLFRTLITTMFRLNTLRRRDWIAGFLTNTKQLGITDDETWWHSSQTVAKWVWSFICFDCWWVKWGRGSERVACVYWSERVNKAPTSPNLALDNESSLMNSYISQHTSGYPQWLVLRTPGHSLLIGHGYTVRFGYRAEQDAFAGQESFLTDQTTLQTGGSGTQSRLGMPVKRTSQCPRVYIGIAPN